jgi:hypothetical protein
MWKAFLFGMGKKKKTVKKTAGRRRGLWSRLDASRRRQVVLTVAVAVFAFTAAGGGALAFIRLEKHVDQTLLDQYPIPRFDFVDLPESLVALAAIDLETAIAPFRQRAWTEDELCHDLADAIGKVPWVESLSWVRRRPQGRFEVSASYRQPLALVQNGSDFVLVDRDGVRLPGTYMYHPAWKLVQGISSPAPLSGKKWQAPDLAAGLEVLKTIQSEPFAAQISAVLVENFDGRKNPRGVRIELATDRAAGRIAWGSPPGAEVEENSVAQKLRILRENFRRTGRVDAGYTVIDISTFPDRFMVPP